MGGGNSTWGGNSVQVGGLKINKKYYESVFSEINKGDFFNAYNILQETIKNYKESEDNSHVFMEWKLPYNLVIPVGEYISDNLGGILTISTNIGCRAWIDKYNFEDVKSGGNLEHKKNVLHKKTSEILEANTLYFMSSNTPHETLLQKKGTKRTLLRITLNHLYENSAINNNLRSHNHDNDKIKQLFMKKS